MHFKADVVDHGRCRVVRLAGRLQAEHVPDLMLVCDKSWERLRLDLADLDSTDAPGLEALLLMEQRGATLEGTSPYLALQLEDARPTRDRQPPVRRRQVRPTTNSARSARPRSGSRSGT